MTSVKMAVLFIGLRAVKGIAARWASKKSGDFRIYTIVAETVQSDHDVGPPLQYQSSPGNPVASAVFPSCGGSLPGAASRSNPSLRHYCKTLAAFHFSSKNSRSWPARGSPAGMRSRASSLSRLFSDSPQVTMPPSSQTRKRRCGLSVAA